MAAVGPFYPSSNSEDTSSGSFSITNRANAYTLDGSYTGVSTNGSPSYWGIWTGFGITGIPSGATITGIAFTITAKRSGAAGGIGHVKPVKAGSITGNDFGSITLTASPVGYVVGGGTDLLGESWADADFGSTFGIAIQVSAFAPGFAQIDCISVQIYYTADGQPAIRRHGLSSRGSIWTPYGRSGVKYF